MIDLHYDPITTWRFPSALARTREALSEARQPDRSSPRGSGHYGCPDRDALSADQPVTTVWVFR